MLLFSSADRCLWWNWQSFLIWNGFSCTLCDLALKSLDVSYCGTCSVAFAAVQFVSAHRNKKILTNIPITKQLYIPKTIQKQHNKHVRGTAVEREFSIREVLGSNLGVRHQPSSSDTGIVWHFRTPPVGRNWFYRWRVTRKYPVWFGEQTDIAGGLAKCPHNSCRRSMIHHKWRTLKHEYHLLFMRPVCGSYIP